MRRAGAAALALALLACAPQGLAGDARVVRIVAKKFSYTPSEVRLKKGEPVILELMSEDRVHGFILPEFKIRKDVAPKEVARVTLTPDKAGIFSFRCDVFCGDGHEDMTGTLIVTE
jgi:cytochrome c oxidase subunit 2